MTWPALTPDTATPLRSLMAHVQVTNLDAYYGSFKAVEGVTLGIEPRSVTAFIGPSGCGKSTLLRTLNRMHEVIPGGRVDGSVTVGGARAVLRSGRPRGGASDGRHGLPAPEPLPDHVGGRQRDRGPAADRLRDKKALAEAVETSLRGAHLWDEVKDRLNRPGAALSGGQQQRLCIARAIAVRPQVLLMDEPCSALDPGSTLAIEELITTLHEEFTIVIVTHNMQQAARVSDRTAFFSLAATGQPGQPGRLVEVDNTRRIFSNPAQQATADYIAGRFG